MVILYVLATINGNKYTFDGYTYKEIAHNIVSVYGYILDKGGEVWVWVPLYPLILSIGYLFGHIDFYIWVLHLILLIFSLTIWITFINEEIKENKIAIYAGLLIVLNTSILYCYVFVLSEAAFITISGLYLYLIGVWLKNHRNLYLAVATIAGFSTLLMRNAGVFFLAGAFVYVFVYLILRNDRKNVIIFSGHIALILSGFIIWNINKLWLGGRMDFVTELVPFLDIARNRNLVSKTIASAFMPFAFPQIIHTVFTVALFAFIIYAFIKYKTGTRIRMLMAAVAFYLLFWLIVPADQWEMERFLAPTFPPLLLVIFYLIEKSKVMDKYPSWIFVLLLLYPFIRILKNALFWGGFLKNFNFDDFLSYL